MQTTKKKPSLIFILVGAVLAGYKQVLRLLSKDELNLSDILVGR